jgi:hypothetical protein
MSGDCIINAGQMCPYHWFLSINEAKLNDDREAFTGMESFSRLKDTDLSLTIDKQSIFCCSMSKNVSKTKQQKEIRHNKTMAGKIAWPSLWLIAALLTIPFAGHSVSLEQNADLPDSLFLGSRFYLNLSSEVDLEDVIAPDTLTRFAILDKEQVKTKHKTNGLRLTIAALDTGLNTFPSLILKPAKPVSDTLRTRPFTIRVEEVRAPGDSTLVDIAGPERLKGELPVWAYYVVGGLLILAFLAALVLLYLRLRKKHRENQVRAPILADSRPNWKKALEDLYRLNELQLPLKGEFINYHFRLSEIMKVFLESEYNFPANEMTTREIRHYFRRKPDLFIFEQDKLVNWLESCDRVKFAKYVPTVDECAEKMDWFMRWLMHNRKESTDEQQGEASND